MYNHTTYGTLNIHNNQNKSNKAITHRLKHCNHLNQKNLTVQYESKKSTKDPVLVLQVACEFVKPNDHIRFFTSEIWYIIPNNLY